MTTLEQKVKQFFPVILFVLLLALGGFAYAFFGVKDFSGPLVGGGDIEHGEMTAYHFLSHVKMLPWPHLQVFTKDVFYPYGVDAFFWSWCLEREYFISTLMRLFGLGPWLQTYVLISYFVTAIGSYVLLRRFYAGFKSAFCAFLIATFNFYALFKFPIHGNLVAHHWVLLGILADFLIWKTFLVSKRVPLRLLLVRFLLVFLALGLDVAYSTGYSLMSLTTLAACTIVVARKRQLNLLSDLISALVQDKSVVGLFAIIATLLCYLYVPILLQVTVASIQIGNDMPSGGSYWANPIRLLIPYFHFLNPSNSWLAALRDSPESLGAASVGWTLLFLAVLGLSRAKREGRLLVYMPMIIVFALCITFHPANFGVLKIFPWFSFHRSSGRSTIIYSTLAVIFSLEIEWAHVRARWFRLVALLGLIELTTAFALQYRKHQPVKVTDDFIQKMSTISNTGGKAILDWPFCLASGNGVGMDVCAHGETSAWALRRFHHKATLGMTFGRMDSRQIRPFLDAGWDHLFAATKPGERDVRCFTEEEWSFFLKFFKYGDFAGVNLFLDQVPKECQSDFFVRIAEPRLQFEAPKGGLVAFIEKPDAWRDLVDEVAVAQLRFEPALKPGVYDFLQIQVPRYSRLDGFGSPDFVKAERRVQHRDIDWEFSLDGERKLILNVDVRSALDNQAISISIDDKPMLSHKSLALDSSNTIAIEAELSSGSHRFNLHCLEKGRKRSCYFKEFVVTIE